MRLKTKRKIDAYFGGLVLGLAKLVRPLFQKRANIAHQCATISIIKILGAGSLVIALPAFLSVKNKFPKAKMKLLCSRSSLPVAELLQVFDEIQVVDDSSLSGLLMSLPAIVKVFHGSDIVLDFEMYSRMTAVLSLVFRKSRTVGLVHPWAKSRAICFDDVIDVCDYESVSACYEAATRVLGGEIPSDQQINDYFVRSNGLESSVHSRNGIAIGHGCSELCKDRMLSIKQWVGHFKKHLPMAERIDVYFLGVGSDRVFADELIAELRHVFVNARFLNACGLTDMSETLKLLAGCKKFWGIDSALLHLSRLLGLEVVAYFGPSNPDWILREYSFLHETIHYNACACSPCAHSSFEHNCNNQKKCMKSFFADGQSQ